MNGILGDTSRSSNGLNRSCGGTIGKTMPLALAHEGMRDCFKDVEHVLQIHSVLL